MAGRRHASGEISAKLAQANELAAKGKTQREISKALGVSIMTYHRWKKMLSPSAADPPESYDHGHAEMLAENSDSMDTDTLLKRLELENSRLRRLVTDMLLDKLRLEDELRARKGTLFGRPNKSK
jgi:transcriptional regulator with XRE-family HTH domain